MNPIEAGGRMWQGGVYPYRIPLEPEIGFLYP